MSTKRWGLLAVIAILLGVALSASPAHGVGQPSDILKGRHIVVLNEGASTGDVLRDHGLAPFHVYNRVFGGFAAAIPDNKLEAVKADGRVNNVVADQVERADVHLNSEEVIPTGIGRIDSEGVNVYPAGTAADCSLDSTPRIVFFDTGIDFDHPDLNVDIDNSATFANGGPNANDKNGHGTHTAGTAAAIGGNAKGVRGVLPGGCLVAVKTLGNNGMGFRSDLIAGIVYATALKLSGVNVVVANYSGGGAGEDTDDTQGTVCGVRTSDNKVIDPSHNSICELTKSGVVFVSSAGNSNADAEDFVPAAYDEVITVSAIRDTDGAGGGLDGSLDDTFWIDSNFGLDVDIAAPGYSILSSWNDGYYAIITVTSMASPHGAGAVAERIASGALTIYADSDPMNSRDLAMSALATAPAACGYAPDSDGHAAGAMLYVGQPADDCAVAVDTTGPTVADESPADGATGVAVSTIVTVTFSEAVDDTTVDSTTFTVNDGADISGNIMVAGDGLSATFTPEADLGNDTLHTVTVTSGVTDTSGNPLDQDPGTAGDQDFTSTFTTVAAGGGGGVSVDSIVDNSIDAGDTIAVTITGSGFDVAGGADVTFENGKGSAPKASTINVVNATTITATVTVKANGPSGSNDFDVRVTNNADASTGVGGPFTVVRP